MSRIQLSLSMKQDGAVRRPSISLRTTNDEGRQIPGFNLGQVLTSDTRGVPLTGKDRVEFHADYSKRSKGLSLVLNTTSHLPHINWSSDNALKSILGNPARLSTSSYFNTHTSSNSKNNIFVNNEKNTIEHRPRSSSIQPRRSSEPSMNHRRPRAPSQDSELLPPPYRPRRSSESRIANLDRELERISRVPVRERERVHSDRPPRAIDNRRGRR